MKAKIKTKKTKNENRVLSLLRKSKWSLPYIFYSLLSLLLILIWFQDRSLIATSDQGLHLLNPTKTYTVFQHVWLEIGLGFSSPLYVARTPYYAFLSLLQIIGLSNWFIETFVYFTSLTMGLLSMVFLVGTLSKNNKWYVPHIAAILYLFNLYVMSQVFIRFLDALFMEWALLPCFLYFWIQWINKSKLRYLFFLLLFTFLFASIFTLISSLFLLWIPAFVYSFITLFTSLNKKKIIYLTIIGFTLWTISNLWWILPVVFIGKNSFKGVSNSENNILSLQQVSQYYPLSELLLLRQKFYFGKDGPWGMLYQNKKYLQLSYLSFFFCLIGVIFSIVKKINYYILSALFIGFFLAKGANPPLGDIFFKFLFTSFPITQILRNPYEKVGLLFVLPYVIFVSIGISFFAEKFKKFKLLFLLFSLLCILVLVRPMFNKNFFPSYYRVHVPNYYTQANIYINNHSNGRIFMMPYLTESNVQYDWGYKGEEPSEILFDKNSLAKVIHMPSIDDYFLSLVKYITQPNFPKLLALANIDTIVMHNDYQSEVGKQNLVQISSGYLTLWKGLEGKKDIGKLGIYPIDSSKIPGLIYLPKKAIVVNSINSGFDEVVKSDFDTSSTVFLINNNNFLKSKILDIDELSQSIKISYKKISNEDYVVVINNAKRPFYLVLSQSFNTLWQARVDKQIFSNHFEVNGFANGWVIDKKGNYTIDISFKVWPWN